MPSHYYIVSGDTRDGPFDSISLLRKARKGELTRETTVSPNTYDAPVRAGEVEELINLFETEAVQQTHDSPLLTSPPISLASILKHGANGFIAHQSITVLFSALAMIVAALAILLSALLSISFTLPLVAPIALASIMLLSIMALRHARSRPMGIEQFNTILGRYALSSVILSIIPGTVALSIPFILASISTPAISVIALLLSPVLAMHGFSAFYLSDHPEISPGEAMKRSRNAARSAGTSSLLSLSVLWALITLAFSSILIGLVFIPIAVLGLADYYEDHLCT